MLTLPVPFSVDVPNSPAVLPETHSFPRLAIQLMGLLVAQAQSPESSLIPVSLSFPTVGTLQNGSRLGTSSVALLWGELPPPSSPEEWAAQR